MNQLKTLDGAWRRYRDICIPADAPPNQIIQTRRAFYIGAGELLNIVMHYLEPGTEPTDEDIELMTSLNNELKAFAKAVETGRA